MTEAEITARITKIDAAIDAVLDGKTASYTINGRSLTNLSLADLNNMRDAHGAKLARLQSSSRTAAVARFRGTG